MFCLDYAVSFVFHSQLAHATGVSHHSPDTGLVYHFGAGALAGAVSAVALYPFDFVRHTMVSESNKTAFAWSSVPFMSAYLGVYFSVLDKGSVLEKSIPNTFARKFAAASLATGTAVAVEFPLDSAKHAMAGGNMRMAIAQSALRIPLGALLLVAYDRLTAPQAATLPADV